MHLLFTRTQIYLAAVQLRNREPEISSWWWPLFAVLIVAMSCLSWNFLAQPATIRPSCGRLKVSPSECDEKAIQRHAQSIRTLELARENEKRFETRLRSLSHSDL
jgi:hypothetical protein